jgi:hypothetical protein
VNDDLQRAYSDALAIVTAERLRVSRAAVGIERFVQSLIRG